ncbi:MAG: hypothetical protein IJF61_06605 [Clostridia bacterium]|nr:hypothetical protein [Clostridia bacterium]
MKMKKLAVLIMTAIMLLSTVPFVSATETLTLNDQISISNVIQKVDVTFLEGVDVYVCQAPVTVTLLDKAKKYTVADVLLDDDGLYATSAGYLPDNGTNEEYWEYEKKQSFPKGLTHTLTSQANPFYIQATANDNTTTEIIIMIENTASFNPSNKVDTYQHNLWSSAVANGTLTINGLYDTTYNKKGDIMYVIDKNTTLTVNRAVGAVYVDSKLCTEDLALCTPITYSTGQYKDNSNWFDVQSPMIDHSFVFPGATISINTPGEHTLSVSMGYQSRSERASIQSSESLDWQNSPKVYFLVIDANPTANYTSSKVLVDGLDIAFEAYNIEDNNYFKLRDIAKVISGSQKQFEVTWDDENGVINLVSGDAYTPVGGELSEGDGEAKPSVICTSKIFKDGKEINLKAYNINGNNYFKLRDLGQAFDFDVSWNGAANCITVETDKSYTAD